MTEAEVLTSTRSDIETAPPERRKRLPFGLRFWRSPADQPRWARPILLAIAALAAVLYAWNIRGSGYALFYSVAVKSMSVSWKAFFFGALDPGATITIDKLAGSFLPQALSARIFGFHQWSLTLPQVLEGVVSVLVTYRMVRRWFGAAAGLIAAGLFALTPILASMFGHPMEDGALTMCLVLAADALMRALAEGRLRSLVWSGVWVGVGFQAKMLQAWMVLPALALTYLFLAPGGWRRRLGHLAVAGAAMLAVSLSWIMLYTVTPAADRPYVDGSTNNSAFAMVFGYNGLDRFGIHVPGSVPSIIGGGGRSGGPPAGFTGDPPAGFTGNPGGGQGFRPGSAGLFGGQGWSKLLGEGYASQVGWLYPLALVALVAGLVWYRRAGRTDLTRAGFVLWGLWLATYAVVFSRIQIPHTAYLASLAPPLVGLCGAGIVLLWRAYRDRRTAWLLPLAIALEVAWTGYLASRYSTFLPWLTWLVVGAGVLAVLVLAAGAALRRVHRAGLVPAMALGTAAMLAIPAAWSLSVLDPAYGGSAFDASAGPGGGRGGPGGARNGPGNIRLNGGDLPAFPGFPGGNGANGAVPGGNGGSPFGGGRNAGPGGGTTDTLTAAEKQLDDYLVAHRDGAKYVAATSGWNSAGSYILATGQPFLPMGGFSGSVPQPTLVQVQHMVAAGQLRFFLLGGEGIGAPGGGGFGGDGRSGSELSRITTWVTSTCTQVPDQQNLYRCGAS